MSPSHKRALRVFVTLAAVAAIAAGCSGDDDSDAADTPESTESPGADATDSIEVVAIDYEYEGLPETMASGTRLTLHNDSPAELHEMVVFRLPDAETRTAEEISQLPEEELESLFVGEPDMVILAPPGEDGFAAVGDGTLTQPGRYVVFCAIPTGADPDEYLNATGDGPPQVEGGPPHFLEGMVGEITVE